MMETLKAYVDIILLERSWSWSLVGIVYLILAFIIRGWFTKPVMRHAKTLESRYYHVFKNAYLKRAIWGWIFFLIPLFVVALFWTQSKVLPLSAEEALVLLGALASFILSIMFHLGALSFAGVDAIKKISQPDKKT